MKKSRKKKAHRIYAFFVLAMGILIIVLTILLLFHIQNVEIKGNDYCSDQEILEVVQNDKFSNNSLYVLGKYAVGKGNTLPCLDELKVSMKTPWRITITVKEKPVVGCVYDKKDYSCFDKEGLVVEKRKTPIRGVPLVEGIKVNKVGEYERLKGKDAGIFEEVLETMQGLKKYGLSAKKIVYEKENIYVYIKNIRVNLGSNVTSVKIAQIPPIMKELGDKGGTLHLEKYVEEQDTVTFKEEKISK